MCRRRRRYEPAESTTNLCGGHSNWRGPVWFPVNLLLVEAVERFARFYGADLTVECPTGSGQHCTLNEAADELARRLVATFLDDAEGFRPTFGRAEKAATRPRAPRPVALPRVPPRRHQRGSRRFAPDRLDRPRR
jgi:hypothetical protein